MSIKIGIPPPPLFFCGSGAGKLLLLSAVLK